MSFLKFGAGLFLLLLMSAPSTLRAEEEVFVRGSVPLIAGFVDSIDIGSKGTIRVKIAVNQKKGNPKQLTFTIPSDHEAADRWLSLLLAAKSNKDLVCLYRDNKWIKALDLGSCKTLDKVNLRKLADLMHVLDMKSSLQVQKAIKKLEQELAEIKKSLEKK